jgi:hypothetical protein
MRVREGSRAAYERRGRALLRLGLCIAKRASDAAALAAEQTDGWHPRVSVVTARAADTWRQLEELQHEVSWACSLLPDVDLRRRWDELQRTRLRWVAAKADITLQTLEGA